MTYFSRAYEAIRGWWFGDHINQRLSDFEQYLIEATISSTPVLVRDFGLTPKYLTHNLPYPIFNPSVVRFKDEILFISRSSNFLNHNDGSYTYASEPHNSVNVFHRYDANLNLIGSDMLHDDLLRLECKAAECGVEDVRLFIWKDNLWAIAAGVQRLSDGEYAVSQLLLRIDRYTVVDFFQLPSPKKTGREKNWIPLVKEERLFIIYSFEPMVVYEYLDGSIVLHRGSPLEAQELRFRGGTQLIPWNGDYIGLVHSSPQVSGKKIYYTHSFVVLNENFELIEMSRPFYLQRKGIEFACGLIEYKGSLLVSYGISDRASAFCILPSELLAQWIVSIDCPSQPMRSDTD